MRKVCGVTFLRHGVLLAQVAYCGACLAGGLAVYEQSASGAARGLAGVAALAEDASTVFYNPAGMTRLSRNEIVLAAGINRPRTRFEDARGTDALGGMLSGKSSVPEDLLYVPSAFFVWVPARDFRVGAGINGPFGQDVKYDEGWMGRYYVTRAELKTVNLSGVLAWRVNPLLSIGGGLDYQWADARRRTAIDFGSACFGSLGPAACAGLGMLPQTQDGDVSLDASSERVGYNVGLLIEPRDGLRVGVAYRSKMRHDFVGTANFAVPPAAALLTAGGGFRATAARSTIILPETLSIGIVGDGSTKLTLLAGLIWSRSSRFQNLVIRFDNPAQPAVVEPQNWKDTYRASAGLDYRITRELTAHGGIAYDESPVPAQFRYPTLPDADRWSLNTGLTWKLRDRLSFTVSYTYAHTKDASVSLFNPAAGALSGMFRRDFHVLGLQAGVKF